MCHVGLCVTWACAGAELEAGAVGPREAQLRSGLCRECPPGMVQVLQVVGQG